MFFLHFILPLIALCTMATTRSNPKRETYNKYASELPPKKSRKIESDDSDSEYEDRGADECDDDEVEDAEVARRPVKKSRACIDNDDHNKKRGKSNKKSEKNTKKNRDYGRPRGNLKDDTLYEDDDGETRAGSPLRTDFHEQRSKNSRKRANEDEEEDDPNEELCENNRVRQMRSEVTDSDDGEDPEAVNQQTIAFTDDVKIMMANAAAAKAAGKTYVHVEDKEAKERMKGPMSRAAKVVFRRFKFLSTENQIKECCEYYMDVLGQMGVPNLAHVEGESLAKSNRLKATRAQFYEVYKKQMMVELNKTRGDYQVSFVIPHFVLLIPH
jgi:hypothetical protein